MLAKQRIHDQFYQNWTARLNNSTRAIFYKNIAELKFQPYLEVLNIVKVRTSLSQLRVSSHRLCVETGRWNKPVSIPFNDRKCSFCNVLEDEYHFVIQCQVFSELRQQFIPKYFWEHPSMYKFLELMNSDNTNLIRGLGNYVNKAFMLRNSILYKRTADS